GSDFKTMQTNYIQAAADDAHAKIRSAALKKAGGPSAVAAAQRFDDADAALSKTMTQFENLVTWLGQVPQGGTYNVISVVREKKRKPAVSPTPTAIPSTTLILASKAFPVGANYTKKDLWTLFVGPPLYVMGGVVLTYELYDPGDQSILAAGQISMQSGYRK